MYVCADALSITHIHIYIHTYIYIYTYKEAHTVVLFVVQVGILAAAGLYALDRYEETLSADHKRMHTFSKGLEELPGIAQPFTAGIHTHKHAYIHTFLGLVQPFEASKHTCIHTYIHAHIYTCMHIYIYMYVYICVYVIW
jgi:hypothetical protein